MLIKVDLLIDFVRLEICIIVKYPPESRSETAPLLI